VTIEGKKACFPERACSNSCCGRFQVSFCNKPSNLIACNNSVWEVFQPNFYLQRVVCLQRLNEGNSKRLQFMSAMRGKANNGHPVFPSTHYHLDIPRMRIVTDQCQDNEIFFRWLHKIDKLFQLLRKVVFQDPSSMRQAAIEPGGRLSRSSGFMLFLENTRRGGTYER